MKISLTIKCAAILALFVANVLASDYNPEDPPPPPPPVSKKDVSTESEEPTDDSDPPPPPPPPPKKPEAVEATEDDPPRPKKRPSPPPPPPPKDDAVEATADGDDDDDGDNDDGDDDDDGGKVAVASAGDKEKPKPPPPHKKKGRSGPPKASGAGGGYYYGSYAGGYIPYYPVGYVAQPYYGGASYGGGGYGSSSYGGDYGSSSYGGGYGSSSYGGGYGSSSYGGGYSDGYDDKSYSKVGYDSDPYDTDYSAGSKGDDGSDGYTAPSYGDDEPSYSDPAPSYSDGYVAPSYPEPTPDPVCVEPDAYGKLGNCIGDKVTCMAYSYELKRGDTCPKKSRRQLTGESYGGYGDVEVPKEDDGPGFEAYLCPCEDTLKAYFTMVVKDKGCYDSYGYDSSDYQCSSPCGPECDFGHRRQLQYKPPSEKCTCEDLATAAIEKFCLAFVGDFKEYPSRKLSANKNSLRRGMEAEGYGEPACTYCVYDCVNYVSNCCFPDFCSSGANKH